MKKEKIYRVDPILPPTGVPPDQIFHALSTLLFGNRPLSSAKDPNSQKHDHLEKFYRYVTKAHFDGPEPYRKSSADLTITHPLTAMYYLAAVEGIDDLDIAQATIAHDLPEDTTPKDPEIGLQEVYRHSGSEAVRTLVETVTKLKSKKRNPSKHDKRIADTSYKEQILQAIKTDFRGIIVKLGDVAHNMKTSPKPENASIALEIYEKLARRLGLIGIARMIGDNALKVIQPAEHQLILDLQQALKPQDIVKKTDEQIKMWEQEGSGYLQYDSISIDTPSIYEVYKQHSRRLDRYQESTMLPFVTVTCSDKTEMYRWYDFLMDKYGLTEEERQINPYNSVQLQEPMTKKMAVFIGDRRYELDVKIQTLEMAVMPVHLLHLDPEESPVLYHAAQAKLNTLIKSYEAALTHRSKPGYISSVQEEALERGSFLFTDRDWKTWSIPRGSTYRDAAFVIGPDLGKDAISVTVIRGDDRINLKITDQIQPGDQVIFEADDNRLLDPAIIDEVTTRKALEDIEIILRRYKKNGVLTSEQILLFEELSRQRGLQIVKWLFEELRGKSLDMNPQKGFENNQALKKAYSNNILLLYEQIGRICLPSQGKHLMLWDDRRKIDPKVKAAFMLIETMSKYRDSLPVVRIELPIDRAGVTADVSRIIDQHFINIHRLDGGTNKDRILDDPDPSYLELVIEGEPAEAIKLIRLIEADLTDNLRITLKIGENFLSGPPFNQKELEKMGKIKVDVEV